MSPRRKSSRGRAGWKRPRDRHEVMVAVLASVAVIIVTASLVWFLRPNRESASEPTVDTVATTTTVAGATTTTLPDPTATTAAPPTTVAP